MLTNLNKAQHFRLKPNSCPWVESLKSKNPRPNPKNVAAYKPSALDITRELFLTQPLKCTYMRKNTRFGIQPHTGSCMCDSWVILLTGVFLLLSAASSGCSAECSTFFFPVFFLNKQILAANNSTKLPVSLSHSQAHGVLHSLSLTYP